MEKKFTKITDKNKWHDLLDKVLFKTFFHLLDWEDFLEKQFNWLKFERYLYADKILLSAARAGDKLISHPFCEYGGPLPLEKSLDAAAFKRDLFAEFKNPVRISFHPQLADYFKNDSAIRRLSGRVSYFIESGKPILRKTTRHEIEKAGKHNLEIKKCENSKELRDFYGLHLKNSKKHMIPAYPYSFFEYFLKSPESEIILAKKGGSVIAGSCFLFYDRFVHYFQNASDERYKNLGANYLILWCQIKKYTDKVFDFGGTRTGSPLQIFKQGWGGTENPIYELKNYPEESSLRDSKFRIVFGLLPQFLIEKISPYLLRYKL